MPAAMFLLLLAPAVSLGEYLDLTELAPRTLAAARPLVEQALGVEFTEPPRLAVLSPDAALVAFQDDLRPEVLRRYPGATPGQRRTLLRALAAASVQSSVARYSVSRKCLVLVAKSVKSQLAAHGLTGDAAKEFVKSAIAHETVHALDDQVFDLAARYGGAADREALRAVSMVIEGRAVHFGTAVAKELGVRPEIREMLPGGKKPADRRAWTFRLTYEQGAKFTAALMERGGLALLAKAMREPPVLTSFLFHPERWPDESADSRPARVFLKAFPDAAPEPLSELELRARYVDLDGPAAAEELLSGFTGGSQWLYRGTNLAVLAFSSEEAAERYLVRSEKEVPAARSGTLLVRAAGPAAEEAVGLLGKAMASLRD